MKSLIDYEKIEPQLLHLILQLNQMEQFLYSPRISEIRGAGVFAEAIDTFRNEAALVIEEQGKRMND